MSIFPDVEPPLTQQCEASHQPPKLMGGWLSAEAEYRIGAEMGLEPRLLPPTSLDRRHLRASGDSSTKFWIVLQSCVRIK